MDRTISKEMLIQDIIQNYPETITVFREYGLECQNCQIAQFEEVSHGATVHHIDPDTLISRLNAVIQKASL